MSLTILFLPPAPIVKNVREAKEIVRTLRHLAVRPLAARPTDNDGRSENRTVSQI
jgi:hypothetical protein